MLQGALACGASLLRPLAFALRAHLAGARSAGATATGSDDTAAGGGSSVGGHTANGSTGSNGSVRVCVRRRGEGQAKNRAAGAPGSGSGRGDRYAEHASKGGTDWAVVPCMNATGEAQAQERCGKGGADAWRGAGERCGGAVTYSAEQVWHDVSPDGQVGRPHYFASNAHLTLAHVKQCAVACLPNGLMYQAAACPRVAFLCGWQGWPDGERHIVVAIETIRLAACALAGTHGEQGMFVMYSLLPLAVPASHQCTHAFAASPKLLRLSCAKVRPLMKRMHACHPVLLKLVYLSNRLSNSTASFLMCVDTR